MRRYLVLNEETDTAWLPWWYPVLKAAQLCNCTPWELLEQSVFWRDVAIKAISAENGARKIMSEH